MILFSVPPFVPLQGQPVVGNADSTAARRMLAMLSVASGVPVEPPCPTLIDADASTLRFNINPPSWPAGRPPVTHYELQFGKKFSLGWESLPHLIPAKLQPRVGAPATVGGAGDGVTVGDGTSVELDTSGMAVDDPGTLRHPCLDIGHTHTYMHTTPHTPHIRTHIHTYTHTHVHTYTHTRIHTHSHDGKCGALRGFAALVEHVRKLVPCVCFSG